MSEQTITQVVGLEEPRGDNAGRVKLSYNGRFHDVRTAATMEGLTDVLAAKGWIRATVRSKKGERVTFYDLEAWEPSGPPDAPANPTRDEPVEGPEERAAVHRMTAMIAAQRHAIDFLGQGEGGDEPTEFVRALAWTLYQDILDAGQGKPVPRSTGEASLPYSGTHPADGSPPPSGLPANVEEWMLAYRGAATTHEVNEYNRQLPSDLRRHPAILDAQSAAVTRITRKGADI